MKITNIEVENYRILKNISIDIEEELSLVIGKNNTGKTSLLSVLSKFINHKESNPFSFEDFNLDYKNKLLQLLSEEKKKKEDFKEEGIKLRIIVKYDENDNLSNISDLMLDLNPENNIIVLSYEYILQYESYEELLKMFSLNEETKKPINYIEKYLKENHQSIFVYKRKSLEFDLENKSIRHDNYLDLNKENISLKNIISFKYIRANRDVSNQDIDKTLSSQTSRLYKKQEDTEEQNEAITHFKEQLIETDEKLSKIYSGIFDEIISKVKLFGGVNEEDSKIEIISNLQQRELLDGNTTVMYNHHGDSLPENYNGLGYMNLISMIFDIDIIMREFRRNIDEDPADINLLFIEEPEAHTHPQLQYIFIKNIKELLREGIVNDANKTKKIQYIISSHSSHIVSESDFEDIKYFIRIEANSIISKNLKDLETEYERDGSKEHYKFIKKYLTLKRSELFFADKAILIEGATERILLPAMMKKLDQMDSKNPLLSQNISIVESGAYSHIFSKFIEFLEIKTLIITDIDSCKESTTSSNKKTFIGCKVDDPDAEISSNSSIKYFLKENKLKILLGKTIEERTIEKNKKTKEWENAIDGQILIAYQEKEKDIEENEYQARSFEDSFFHINRQFIKDNLLKMKEIKKNTIFDKPIEEIDPYEFSLNALKSKTSFAIEILLFSETDSHGMQYSNWETPLYIKKGLEWLKKN